jgi:hypothetical protein
VGQAALSGYRSDCLMRRSGDSTLFVGDDHLNDRIDLRRLKIRLRRTFSLDKFLAACFASSRATNVAYADVVTPGLVVSP